MFHPEGTMSTFTGAFKVPNKRNYFIHHGKANGRGNWGKNSPGFSDFFSENIRCASLSKGLCQVIWQHRWREAASVLEEFIRSEETEMQRTECISCPELCNLEMYRDKREYTYKDQLLSLGAIDV